MDRRSLLATLPAAPWSGRPRCDLPVQSAVDGELGPLLDARAPARARRREIRLTAWSFWRGRIGAQRVVLGRTDVGLVNALASTAAAVLQFHPRAVINQGRAGPHNRSLRLWDILLGEKTTA